MADTLRVRLYREDGTVETAHAPIDAAVTLPARRELRLAKHAKACPP